MVPRSQNRDLGHPVCGSVGKKQRQLQKQIPKGNDSKKGKSNSNNNCNSQSKSNSKGKGNVADGKKSLRGYVMAVSWMQLLL